MKTKLHSGILKLVFLVGLFFVASNSYGQITFTSWTYEPFNGTFSNPTPNIGSGASSVVNNGGGTITPGSRTGMKPGTPNFGCGSQDGVTAWAFEPFDPGSANESNGAQFTSSTDGYENIKFVWDQRWSNTAANTVRVQYTLNGSTWTNFNMNGSNTVFCNGSINSNGCFEANSTGDIYRRMSVDFSSITAASNNPNFGVRLMAAYYQSATEFRQVSAPGSIANPGGTWRFDNVSFTGTLLSGPTASVMSGNGTVCAGGSANSIIVTITGGISPFILQYTDNISGSIVTLNPYVSGSPISVTPAAASGNVIYSIVSVANTGNGAVGIGNSGNGIIAVNPQPSLPASVSNLMSFTTCSPAVFPTGSPTNYSNATETGAYYDAGTNLPITIPYTGPSINFYFRVTTLSTGCYKNSTVYTYVKKDPVAIITPPSNANQTVCQGDPFLPITVTYSGIATSFQWYRRLAVSPFTVVPLTCGSFCAEVANGSTTISFTPLSTGAAYAAGTSYQYYVRVTGACNTTPNSAFSGIFSVTAPTVAGNISSAQTICIGTAPANLTISGNDGVVLKWQKADDIGFTTNVVDYSNATTTLTSAEIGPLSQTAYFRAFLQKNSCSIKTTTPIQVLIKSTTWTILPIPPAHWSAGVPDSNTTVIFDTDYSSTGDLLACSVLVNSGNVVFNPSHTLTIQNGLTVSGGTLTFENNASLVQVNNAVNSGVITYNRQTSTAVTKFDYTYWSSPVNPQTLSNFSPTTLSDKYFWMNPIPYIWEAVAVPGLTNMTPGQGYIIRGPQENVTASLWEGSFIGVPNNGDITPEISGLNSVVYTDATHNLNCLGNPYPSAISADLLMSGNPSTLGTGTTLYFWTHNTSITNGLYTFNDYAIYNYSGGTGTIKAPSPGANTNIPNGKIAAGQGFMIKAATTGLVTFRNSMRLGGAADNNQFYKINQDAALTNLERNRVWLELENEQGAYKQILVGYVQNATNNFEDGYDGEALEAGNPISLYSMAADKKLAIQGRALPFDVMDQVALGFKSPSAGTYTISLSNFDGLFSNEDVSVYLEDKLLNITHNLKENAYSFVTESGTFDTRFVLRFTALLGVTDNLLNPAAVILFKNQDQIVINSGNKNMAGVEIFDITGRLLYKNNSVNNSEITIDSSFANEVLIVKIKFPDNQLIVRKFLN